MRSSQSSSPTRNESADSARTVGETLWDLRTPDQVAKFARQIELSRVAHGHKLNERSSRSHCLVRLQSTSISAGGELRTQCFTFVDLAGSERTAKSGVEGQRKSEAIDINGSLTVLGRCIRTVILGKKHVPWRDSVLTQLLRTSFEGKRSTHTSVVVNISPQYHDETMCTLRFGETVSCVSNDASSVIGQDARARRQVLQREEEGLRAKKRAMESAGQGSGFVQGCINSEKNSLQTNMVKLNSLEAQLAGLKVQQTEAADRAETATLANKIEILTSETFNLREVVFRQRTIKSLWREATPMFNTIVAELNEAENQLKMLI